MGASKFVKVDRNRLPVGEIKVVCNKCNCFEILIF